MEDILSPNAKYKKIVSKLVIMDARIENTMTLVRPGLTYVGERALQDQPEASNGRVVGVLRRIEPDNKVLSSNQAQREGFKKAFFDTLEGKAEGVLTPYLFFDLPKTSPQIEQGIWGSQTPVSVGARAWDEHISQSFSNVKGQPNAYGFTHGDVEVIKLALSQGLADVLPSGAIAYFGYGVGEKMAVTKKDGRIISGMLKAGKNITNLNAVDMNDRYVSDALRFFHDKYNITSSGISGDFMEGPLLPIPPEARDTGSTAIISLFGGPFGNAPNISGSTPMLNAVRYLRKVVDQHGPGSHILMTMETRPSDPALSKAFIEQAEARYARTKVFEAFLLSAFPRAVHDNIISKPYDVFKNWKMVTRFDPDLSTTKLIAECKEDHIIHTSQGSYEALAGSQIVPILSNKWTTEEVTSIFNVAGARHIKIYGEGTHKLVHAVMGTAPAEPSM